MTPKEIIFVSDYIKAGGVERVTHLLTETWSKAGHHVILVSFFNDKEQGGYDMAEDIEVVPMQLATKSGPMRNLFHCIMLYRFLRQHPKAITVSFCTYSTRILGIAGTLAGNTILFSERNDPGKFPTQKWVRTLRDIIYVLAKVKTYVFQTEEALQYFPKRVREKGVIIPNPMNPVLPEIWAGPRRKVAVAACRISPQKNLPMMIKAFAKFSREHPEYTLEIYGSNECGGAEPQVREMIREMRMQDTIFLKGFTDAIYDKMRDCSMYVSSSDYEGISNSMLEALGMGVPTIVTDCPVGGARMMIQNYENGILVPVGDVESLYRAMKKVAEEPEFAKKISQNAYKLRDKFKVQAIAEKWLEIM